MSTARDASTGEFVTLEFAAAHPDTTVVESDPEPGAFHRRFLLVREVDVTGISGLGAVAEGIEFSDGQVALRWLAPYIADTHKERGVRPTTVIHESVQSVEALHGHNGATRIEWIDS